MSARTPGPCMCGATDCASCGPAQGYTVVRKYVNGRVTFVNPDDDEDGEGGPATLEGDDFGNDEPDDHAADRACDRWERDIDARHP